MVTLIQWRMREGKQTLTDTSAASAMMRISWVQTGLIVLMIFAATGMVRGLGASMW